MFGRLIGIQSWGFVLFCIVFVFKVYGQTTALYTKYQFSVWSAGFIYQHMPIVSSKAINKYLISTNISLPPPWRKELWGGELSLTVFCLDLFPPCVLREDLFLNHWWGWLCSEHPRISCLLHSRAVFISTFCCIQLLMWVLGKQAQESVFVENAHCQLCCLPQLRVNQHLREKYLLGENSVKCLFPFILNDL